LGGYNDLRGFDHKIGPKFEILRSPNGFGQDVNRGGDKLVLFQLEYFVPLIPEAGIKALVFTDFGRVYDNPESMEMYGFHKDVGFGFRWITPIAPFRFEWAYPIEEDGKLGDMEIIFSIGY
jgi:outer membrane protein insertion porin family